ncbi:MAG: hypothetical protein A2086_15230 [Spirochaetes bacterium GWD1_27_9]|nr:MAG: hypothetical protein A2Z98_05960 [Spirochaetes bacterium GWB1_27_13]OHD25195.1 MAG: hypothetical protein A2Y34_15040 [Spirochaetes bacterium GWC1_27_15]OHD31249.1 MAG: hypothetical protein A2086_15230 [Spirochaetes bacterium GWD1_27_9]
MQTTFNDLVDMVRDLSLSEKVEIKTVLEKEIIEEKRNKIHKNYLKAKKEFKENKLEFSNDINKLKKMI